MIHFIVVLISIDVIVIENVKILVSICCDVFDIITIIIVIVIKMNVHNFIEIG
jgi:hypothetical protein